jgi:tetratricopeptide (TPR) repeat protein
MRNSALLTAFLVWWVLPLKAQVPLAKPLADFDKLVSQLKPANVVGDPIQAGNVTVVPFSRINFMLGSGEAIMGFGGDMGEKTVPLGILIVEGDEVRMEQFPEPDEKPSALQELMQSILDQKLIFIGNGLNIGNATGAIQDLAPLLSALNGQTTIMGNGLNLGELTPPAAVKSSAKNESLKSGDLNGAIADLEATIARKPSPEAYYHLGEAYQKKGLRDKAAAAYKKALELQPNYPEAIKALAAIK